MRIGAVVKGGEVVVLCNGEGEEIILEAAVGMLVSVSQRETKFCLRSLVIRYGKVTASQSYVPSVGCRVGIALIRLSTQKYTA